MNERRLIGLALIALVAVTGGCSSTGSGVELGILATELDGGDLGEGFGGGAKLELNPIDLISIDGRVSWIRHDDTDIDVVPLEAAALLNLPLFWEHFVPYVGVGAGYYLFDGDGADLDDEWGYFPLLGVELGLQKLSFIAEARYLQLETDVKKGVGPLAGKDKADMNGFGVNMGLIIRF